MNLFPQAFRRATPAMAMGLGAGLAAPPLPRNTGAVVMLVSSLAFPLSGALLLSMLPLDWLVVSRLRGEKAALS